MHNLTLKTNEMAESKSKIQDLRMEPADNGVIITWTEKTKSPSKGTFDNCIYKDHKLVYDMDSDEADEAKSGLEEAFAKYKELWMKSYTEMKG